MNRHKKNEIYKSGIELKVIASSKDKEFTQFEYMYCSAIVRSFTIRLAIIYRPPPSKDNGLNTNVFLKEEWPLFLSKYVTIGKNITIVGDLNFHLDIPNNRETSKFLSCLDSFGLIQHVNEPTHVAGHTLDVVITWDNDNIISNIEVIDPCFSDSAGRVTRDHFAVTLNANASKPAPVRKTVYFRKIRGIDIDLFKSDIQASECFKSKSFPTDMDELVDSYTAELSSLVDKHAPVRTKSIVLRPSCPWYSDILYEENILNVN